MNTPSKICRVCGNSIGIDQLVKNTRRKDGYESICKFCNRLKAKIYRNTHLEIVREKDKIRARQFRREHRDKAHENVSRYYQKHKQQMARARKAWRMNNKQRYNAMQRRRYARKRQIGGEYSVADIQRQYKAQKGKCYWCDEKLDPHHYHVDHVIPLARGGWNGPENIVIACPHCNQSKNDRLPHEWSGNGGKML